jgi:hypothetical protein
MLSHASHKLGDYPFSCLPVLSGPIERVKMKPFVKFEAVEGRPAMETLPEEDRPISTKEMSALLTSEGYPTAAATLTKLRCCGGGPPYLKFGRAVRYRPSVGRAWAQAKTKSRLHTSQSE